MGLEQRTWPAGSHGRAVADRKVPDAAAACGGLAILGRTVMPAYHQMGHDSQNLLGEVPGFRGAIISPVNETEADVEAMVNAHASEAFEFVFDPQLYFPRRGDRGQLGTWSYFPRDFDTADMTSEAWWAGTLDAIATTAARVGASRRVLSRVGWGVDVQQRIL